jgi:hypothetical protein
MFSYLLFYLFYPFLHIHDLCCTEVVVFHCRNVGQKWSVRIRNANVLKTTSSRLLLLASWVYTERVAAAHFLPSEGGNHALIIYWTAIYENKNIKPTREICWKHLANLSITALFSSYSILCIKGAITELNVDKCLSGFWFSICMVTCRELLIFLLCVVYMIAVFTFVVHKDVCLQQSVFTILNWK